MNRYDPKYIDVEERELIKDLKKINVQTLKRPKARNSSKSAKRRRSSCKTNQK